MEYMLSISFQIPCLFPRYSTYLVPKRDNNSWSHLLFQPEFPVGILEEFWWVILSTFSTKIPSASYNFLTFQVEKADCIGILQDDRNSSENQLALSSRLSLHEFEKCLQGCQKKIKYFSKVKWIDCSTFSFSYFSLVWRKKKWQSIFPDLRFYHGNVWATWRWASNKLEWCWKLC